MSRIAIVGTGISGLVAARGLHARHELTVYESSDWIGGHTHTLDVPTARGPLAIDTGFIVFNELTYPGLCALFDELGVATQPSTMSFSVRDERCGLEYNGTDLDGLFAQRVNLVRPSFWRMLYDLARFYREAPALLAGDAAAAEETLGAYLARRGYSRAFVEQHLVPMAAAVWSARPDEMRAFPLRFLVQFFHNHGFLRIHDRPQWRVVSGGSRSYVAPLVAPFRDRIRLRTPVARVEPGRDDVLVRTARGEVERYDRVVLACHADTSLRLLAAPTTAEREVLGAFRFQSNDVLLHTARALMPKRRRAWASWNYHVTAPPSELPTVTYWMNRLQDLPGEVDYFVTLNRTHDVDPAAVLARFEYHHPVFSVATVRAREQHARIDGARRVHFCGAYWGYGFHEDGLQSANAVLRRIEAAESAARRGARAGEAVA